MATVDYRVQDALFAGHSAASNDLGSADMHQIDHRRGCTMLGQGAGHGSKGLGPFASAAGRSWDCKSEQAFTRQSKYALFWPPTLLVHIVGMRSQHLLRQDPCPTYPTVRCTRHFSTRNFDKQKQWSKANKSDFM
jgi:hypothetical protein